MTDRISPERRSWNMSRIGSRDTKPELVVRSVLHRMGYRFRLHRKGLAGTPDIVLPRYGTVIFVHGCFWHRHKGCSAVYTPKTRTEFWKKKFGDNVRRDRKNTKLLKLEGWRVLVVWECETETIGKLQKLLAKQMKRGWSPI